MNQRRFLMVRAGLCLAASGASVEAVPLGMAFAYRGQLKRDGGPVDFDASSTLDVGGFNVPFHSMPTTVAHVTRGAGPRFEPGTTGWSGMLSRTLLMDAPLGSEPIGG